MITRLKDGSVIVNSESLLPVSQDENADIQEAFNKVYQQHGMIYFNKRIYHAAAGDKQEGVRSHSIDLVMKENVMDAYLGSITVIECVDEDLRKRFIQAMSRWDPVELLEKLRNQSQHSDENSGRTKLPTPFMEYYDRKSDHQEQSAKCELYRAVRAYQRNHINPPEPLSSKGVSCGNFIAYSFKAAIIDALFPDGLTNDILQKMDQIAAIRQEEKSQRSDKAEPMKLSDVSKRYPYLDELLSLVKQHITQEHLRHFEFLQTPVKRTSIKSFCHTALEFPEFWKVSGVMYGYTDKDINTPYVMDYTAYCATRRSDIDKKTVTALLLPHERVERAVLEKSKDIPKRFASSSALFKQASQASDSQKSNSANEDDKRKLDKGN